MQWVRRQKALGVGENRFLDEDLYEEDGAIALKNDAST